MKIKNSTALYVGIGLSLFYKLNYKLYTLVYNFYTVDHHRNCDYFEPRSLWSVDHYCKHRNLHVDNWFEGIAYLALTVIDVLLLIALAFVLLAILHLFITKTIDEEEPSPDNPKASE